MNLFKCAWLSVMILVSAPAWAETRASVNRTSIHVDESVRLVIETDRSQTPDEARFTTDFVITARSTGRSISYSGGRVRTSTRFEYELSPRRAGRIIIPPLKIGADTTSALVVDVANAAAGSFRGPNNGAASNTPDVFIRSSVSQKQAYAQQGVLLTVRFYVGRSMIDVALDQPSVRGATLQQIASDVQTTEALNGRTFQVVTRQYWVVPDQAGTVRIPGARLVGTTAGGFFDEAFGDGIERVSAVAETVDLSVRSRPLDAKGPWLPLNNLVMRYLQVPAAGVSQDNPAHVTVEMVADGALAADLPELTLQADNQAQVFPEPAQSRFVIRNGRLVTTVTRAFSILPTRGGEISLTVPPVAWWNVTAAQDAVARLNPLKVPVAGAIPAAPDMTTAAAKERGWLPGAGVPFSTGLPWVIGAVAVLCVFAGFLLRRTSRSGAPRTASERSVSTVSAAPVQTEVSAERRFTQALAAGDLGQMGRALCALAEPATASLEVVANRLANADQQDAVRALQAALWGGADGEQARQRMRSAFADPPEWVKSSPKPVNHGLPPLYPTH